MDTIDDISTSLFADELPPGDHKRRRWWFDRHVWNEITWRFGCSLFFSCGITGVLYGFSTLGNLSHWEKRWFSVLAIILSSLVSMSVGSLLGFLGSMLRGPLLARKLHRPIDVDLILGMFIPTGAWKLVWHHTARDKKWTSTTLAAAIHFLINVTGRLSVATFGLTFDLNEFPGYPVMITDWNMNSGWVYRQHIGKDNDRDVYQYTADRGMLNDFSKTALFSVDTNFYSPGFNDQIQTLVLNGTASSHGLNREVEGDNVTYSYLIKEYQGLDTRPSKNKTISSSSKCLARNITGFGDVYEKGKYIGNINTTTPESEEFFQVLTGINATFGTTNATFNFRSKWDPDLWIIPKWNCNSQSCVTSYIFNSKGLGPTVELFECTTCLSHSNNSDGIGSDVLAGLPSDSSSDVSCDFLTLSGIDKNFKRLQWRSNLSDLGERDKFGFYDGALYYREYGNDGDSQHFLGDRHKSLRGTTFALPHEREWNERREHKAELFAAHLSARLPILAIMGADMQLPRTPRDPDAPDQQFVKVVLEVRWRRAIAVLLSILLGQLIAVSVTVYMCRNVFVREHDSYLSVSSLMVTAMGTMKGHSKASGAELARYLEDQAVKMRYGTRKKGHGYEVDLWDDVRNEFPGGHYQ